MTRYVLMAASTGDRALSFDVRYFEVAAGGYSTLERHDHPHAVLVLSGRGQVILDDEVSELTPFDCVYVAPGTLHQFRAAPDEPLGFLCIVDRDRDKPAAATPDDIARLCRNPVIAELLQTGRKLGPS
ncbi:MAG: cupin domain-containing protein [Candidatus Dadabacteria bacterium]|nr:MAG: cupin domain-containing protein [Candidatus Dadabacteria bacterium]